MHFFSFIISFFLATVLSLSSIRCHDLPLTPFGEKVKSILPEDTKNKTFYQNYESLEELEKAEIILPKRFMKALGTSYNPCLIKEVNDATTRVLESHQKDVLFESITNAFAHFLEHAGKLNSSNVDYMAQKYVDELNKVAKTVPDNYSIIFTFPALVIANGKFLKFAGVTSQNDVNRFIQVLTKAFNKFANHAPMINPSSVTESQPALLTENLKLLKSKDLTLQNDLSVLKILDSKLNITII